MAAPTVQSVQDIISQLTAAFKPQSDLIDQSITSNEQSGQAQTAGLDARKDTAFGQITQAGNNRGMLFSGFSPNEQAKYTSGTYLPALAALQGKIADVRSSLLGKKADISTQSNTKAIDLHNSQQSAYDAWQQHEEDMARQAAEAEKQRQFEAGQNQLKISSSERMAAAGRAASGAGQPSKQEQFASALSAAAGKDGKVSPGDFQALKHQWVTAGYGSAGDFTNKYWSFANKGHWWDYYYG